MAGCDAEETGYPEWAVVLVVPDIGRRAVHELVLVGRASLPASSPTKATSPGAAVRVGVARGNRQGAEAIVELNRVAV